MYISVQAYKKFIFSTESCVHFLFPLQLMAWWKNNDHMLIFPPVIAHRYGTLYGTYKTEVVDWNFTSWFWSLQTSERKSHNMTMFKSMGPYCKVLSSFLVLSDYLITSECLWIMWKDTSSSICRCFFLWLYGSVACSCLLLFVCVCVVLLIQSLFKNHCLKYLFFLLLCQKNEYLHD